MYYGPTPPTPQTIPTEAQEASPRDTACQHPGCPQRGDSFLLIARTDIPKGEAGRQGRREKFCATHEKEAREKLKSYQREEKWKAVTTWATVSAGASALLLTTMAILATLQELEVWSILAPVGAVSVTASMLMGLLEYAGAPKARVIPLKEN